MTKPEFDAVLTSISAAYAGISDLPIREFIADLERDEAFGCFVDNPMAWSGRREICSRIKDMAEAARVFVAKGDAAREQGLRDLNKAANAH